MLDSKTIDAMLLEFFSLPTDLGEDEWIQQTIESIRETGSFYFVSLYLKDLTREKAVFQAGTGQAGERMRSMKYEVDIGLTSHIGKAIYLDEIQLLNWQEEFHYFSPLYPDARWKITLPLRVSGQTIGALEIGISEEITLCLEDVKPLQQVADEVANELNRINQC